jgi:mRNA interferase RelE/StbE
VPWTVIVQPPARRSLNRLPAKLRERILRALIRLEADPFVGDVRKLSGQRDTWRLRIGDYRVIYEIEGDRLLVLVIRIGHRRDVYR